MANEFASVMQPLATYFFGSPNPALSSEYEWRYGSRGSLSIDLRKGTFFDHEISKGGGVLELVSRETHLVGTERIDWLTAKGFLFETISSGNSGSAPRPTIVATYDYCDADGALLFQVCRFEPKDFRQRRPDGAGGWEWSVKGVQQVPYRLPDLLDAGDRVVFVVEGEKDADRLWRLGVPATCNAGGANKWRSGLSEYFHGSDVVVLPDHDGPGQDHAVLVAGALTGIARRVRVLELWNDWPEMPLKGDVSDWLGHGGTAERLYALADGCAVYAPIEKQTAQPVLPIPLRSAFPIDESKIPLRDWVIPGLLLRRNLTVMVAPPASGKSLLTLQIAIAIALGIPWGGWFPRKAEKVLVINAEDDFDEMCRRLCAAAKLMGVDQTALTDRIYLAEEPETIVIAKMDHRTKSVIRTPLGEALVTTIQAAGIGVCIADPFAETFEGDENSNSEVKWAGILWREVARKTRTALWLVHHTKKYSGSMAGEQDASRGGGALIGTARIMSTLFGMTEDEAKLFDVPADDRGLYVRFDDAKANHSKKGVVRWFEKKTVALDNGDGVIAGDDVGVLSAWKPPGLMDNIGMPTITLILDKIARGVTDDDGNPTGELYGKRSNSRCWAGEIIKDMVEMDDDDRAKGLIKLWLDNKVLVETEYKNDRRKIRTGLQVVPENRPDRAMENFT